MQIYCALPSIDWGLISSPVDTVKRLRTSKQRNFNQVILARIELIRLIVLSAIELGVHVARATAKFTAAVISVPFYLIFGGPTPRVALIDSGSDMARSAKLALAIFCTPLLGLLRPEWSVSLYQRLSLVKVPNRRIARAFERIRSLATAWSPSLRNLALGVATVAALTRGNSWYSSLSSPDVPPIPPKSWMMEMVGDVVECVLDEAFD